MDVLSGGESDAGDTLSRRNNNSMTSTRTDTMRTRGGPGGRGAGDVCYHVAKELLMTGRAYMRHLELVTVTWSGLVSTLASTHGEVACRLARPCFALEPLVLAAGALLAKLERMLAPTTDNKEPEYKKIAEVLYEYLSNNYEAYSTYIAGAGELVGVTESARRGGRAGGEGGAGGAGGVAAECCAQLESRSPLALPTLLLRPLQRAQHYRRLAAELSEELDTPVASSLLSLARSLAQAASAALAHCENHVALCHLQRDILGYDKLLVGDREFLRMGCVYKHSTKGLQQRMLFLFSDIVMVCSKAGGQFRAGAVRALRALRAQPSALPHSLTLTGEDTNFLLSASNQHEYNGWMTSLTDAIEAAKLRNDDVDTELTPVEPDEHLSTQQNGLSGSALTHVCWHRVTSLSMAQLQQAKRTQLSGYLLRKFKNSHGWQKLWVEFCVASLFFYKSWQEPAPLAALPLLGYSVGPPSESDDIHKDFVFKLQYKSHVYFFRADSQYTYNRWLEVLQAVMVQPDQDIDINQH